MPTISFPLKIINGLNASLMISLIPSKSVLLNTSGFPVFKVYFEFYMYIYNVH